MPVRWYCSRASRRPPCWARQFEARRGIRLFHSVLVHYENEIQIQVEDRWVNAALAPDYLSQDFTHSTPNEYLMRVAPLQGVSYRIEAKLPPAEIRNRLAMPAGEPCLVLYRTTRSRGMVASVATMWHPASRYQFTACFSTCRFAASSYPTNSEDNMTHRVVECVPNFSEGRDMAKMRQITEAIASVSG